MLPPVPIKRHIFVFILSVACLATYLQFQKKLNDQKTTNFHQFSRNISIKKNIDLFYNKTLILKNLLPMNKNKLDLHILGLFELNSKFGTNPKGSAEVEAANLAIKHVNSMNVLSCCNLNLLINDTEVACLLILQIIFFILCRIGISV